jgi:MSHA biogenesis protein MshP
MTKKMPHFGGRPQETGASVIFAIFLLLLMASLAAFMTNLVSVSNANLAADIGGSRAYQAARAGAEWGMFQLDPNGAAAAMPACVGGTPPIPDHNVVVVCANTDHTEAGRTIRIFRITSTAVATGVKAPGIERTVQVTLEKCRDPGITTAPFDC